MVSGGNGGVWMEGEEQPVMETREQPSTNEEAVMETRDQNTNDNGSATQETEEASTTSTPAQPTIDFHRLLNRFQLRHGDQRKKCAYADPSTSTLSMTSCAQAEKPIPRNQQFVVQRLQGDQQYQIQWWNSDNSGFCINAGGELIPLAECDNSVNAMSISDFKSSGFLHISGRDSDDQEEEASALFKCMHATKKGSIIPKICSTKLRKSKGQLWSLQPTFGKTLGV